jgi:hypothetical protein
MQPGSPLLSRERPYPNPMCSDVVVIRVEGVAMGSTKDVNSTERDGEDNRLTCQRRYTMFCDRRDTHLENRREP